MVDPGERNAMNQFILTVGPVSEAPEQLDLLARVATRLRLNVGHLTPEKLERLLQQIVERFAVWGKVIPVVLDLQGAKLRIGDYPAVSSPPSEVELIHAYESSDPAIIPVPHESIFRQTCPGDLLLLNDRKVVLRVRAKPSADRLFAQTLQAGELGPAKGISSPDRVFELARVAPVDFTAIEIGNRYPAVEYAVSFVGDGEEAALFRPLIEGRRLIAKIERRAAIGNLAAIDRAFDELWLCRGDLGADVGLRELGVMQQRFVERFPELTKPKILAGEVLGSMVNAPQPSRSEIVHLHDVRRAGFDGIVLSDETARGRHLAGVVTFLHDHFASEGS